MSTLLLPPKIVELQAPHIFLAGPIQGAIDWQSTAIDLLVKEAASVVICSPRNQDERKGTFSTDAYNKQVDWEHHYLKKAFHTGAVMFWLAKEHKHDCSRAYAQTSRFELGWMFGLAQQLGTVSPIVVGIEAGFSNERYLRRTLRGIQVHGTLENTCRAAIKYVESTMTPPTIDAAW